MSASYVARQPIFDRRQRTVAYELLFRSAGADRAQFIDGNVATARTIVGALADIGLDALVGDALALFNAGYDFIVDGHFRVCPPERVVVEVLEDVPVDQALLGALRDLVAAGYRIALDDLVSVEDGMEPLLELAHLVKVDVMGVDPGELGALVERLRPYAVELLAEKVETEEMHQRCRDLGFSLFQGYYFSRPTTMEAATIPTENLTRMKLLAHLQDENTNPDELEQIVSLDLGLSHRTLRIINSAYFGMPRKIGSIREGIVMLGYRRLRALATLVVLADASDRPRELLVTALMRAKMCELLAERTRLDPEQGFTVGLFSVADALLNSPMDIVLEHLPFAGEVKDAIGEHAGTLGDILHVTELYERGELDEQEAVDVEAAERAYVDALRWSRDARSVADVA